MDILVGNRSRIEEGLFRQYLDELPRLHGGCFNHSHLRQLLSNRLAFLRAVVDKNKGIQPKRQFLCKLANRIRFLVPTYLVRYKTIHAQRKIGGAGIESLTNVGLIILGDNSKKNAPRR